VPHPFAFLLANGWETTNSPGREAQLAAPQVLAHPFAFFLANGWKTTNLKIVLCISAGFSRADLLIN